MIRLASTVLVVCMGLVATLKDNGKTFWYNGAEPTDG